MGGFYHGSVNSDAYVILAGGGYKSVSDFSMSHSHPYLPLAGGTMTGAINFTSTNAKLAFGSLATSPITGYKAPSLGSNGVGIYSRYGGSSDEGAIIITEDTCVIYNSADTGWNFQVLDKDLGTDMTNDATRSFGVAQDHKVFSLGGYVKSGSSDSYVLLGGGGHKALSDFSMAHSHSYHPLGGSWKPSSLSSYTRHWGWAYSSAEAGLASNGSEMQIYTDGKFWQREGAYYCLDNGNTYVSSGTGVINGTTITNVSNSTYATYATHWNASNLYSSSSWAWNPFGLTQYWCWGESFKNTSVSSDTGDLRFYLASISSAGGAGICMNIDGHIATLSKVYAGGGFIHGSVNSNSYVLLAGGGYKAISDFSGSSDVYWKDVKDKIRHSNEFNIVPSGYNSTMWFNYRSDADTNVTVSEYIFGNGSGSASAAIKAGTVYPGSNASYNIGKTDSRWDLGYFNSGLYIGGTSYTGEHTNAAGTTIKSGYIELSNTNAYIDFHRSGYYTSDYSSRLIHWHNRDRLSYECYSSTYSGYVATCEGNANNLVIIGVFDLYKTNDTTLTWSISTICGPCSFSLQKDNSIYDVSYKSRTSSAQSWTISGNVLRVYVNGPSSNTYAWKSTPYAVSCDARVMTRWINNQPVVTNCLHGDWQGSSVECLCTNLSNGSSLYYYSYSPGRYIYITGSRPWGYDDGSNGMGMDMMRMTGNLSYQRIRFTVFGYLS